MSRATRRCIVWGSDGRNLSLDDAADFYAVDRFERSYERREDVGMSGMLEVLLHRAGRWFVGKAVGHRTHRGDGTFTDGLAFYDGTGGYSPPGYDSFDEIPVADVHRWFKAKFGYVPDSAVDLLAAASEAPPEPAAGRGKPKANRGPGRKAVHDSAEDARNLRDLNSSGLKMPAYLKRLGLDPAGKEARDFELSIKRAKSRRRAGSGDSNNSA